MTTKLHKPEQETVLNGTAGMQATVAHLQCATDAANEAAWYFECLGMYSQSEQLDSALEHIEHVQDLLGVFLETVVQTGPFAAKPSKKPRKPRRRAGHNGN